MKKVLLISVLVCLAGLNQLFAANPIPSYNVLVSGKASFQESTKPSGRIIPGKARRMMNIETTTSSGTNGISNTIVAAVVYRLDGSLTLGPYYIVCGQSLVVGVDDKPWGVNVTTEVPVKFSVWASMGLLGN
jgi:hypothetical protein